MSPTGSIGDTRVPRLRLHTAAGLRLPDLDATWLAVEDGRLVHTVRGVPSVLAEPGEVTRLSVAALPLRTAQRITPIALRGLLLVWSGERLVAAVNLAEIWDAVDGRDARELRAVSGLDALAQRLGLVVEAATAAETDRARRLRQRDVAALHDVRVGRRGAAAVSVLCALVGFVPAMLILSSGEATLAARVTTVVALAVWVVVGHRHRVVRERLLALVDTGPEPRVEVVDREVRARWRGSEHRVDDIAEAVRTPTGVALFDRRRRHLLTLLDATSPDANAGVLADLAATGVPVVHDGLERGGPGAHLWLPGSNSLLWADDDRVTGGTATAGIWLTVGLLGTSVLMLVLTGGLSAVWAPFVYLILSIPVIRTERAWSRWRRAARRAAR